MLETVFKGISNTEASISALCQPWKTKYDAEKPYPTDVFFHNKPRVIIDLNVSAKRVRDIAAVRQSKVVYTS